MSINNKNLLHQLKEHFGSSIPIELLPFLGSVNEVYNKGEIQVPNPGDALVKVKNKTKTAADCARLKVHHALIQKTTKTGSWEFDFPEHTTTEHKKTGDAHVYYFSDEVYRILGLEPGSFELSKDFFFPQLNPYDLSLILESASEEGHDNKQYEEEHTLRLKDGTERVVLKKSDIFFDRNSLSPSKIIGTLQDITETKTLENELYSVKKEKEAILQNMFNAYLSYDVINDKVLFSNVAFQKIFENTPLQNKSSQASFLSLILDEDKAGAYTLFRKLVKGVTAFHSFRIRTNDGSYRWLESRLVPALGADGRLVRIELVANDITAWKKADNSANEIRNDLQKQLFGVGEVVLLLNDKLALTYVSENINRLLGYMPEEITGTDLADIVCAADMEHVTGFYSNILAGNKELNRIAFRFRSKVGDEIWCECVVHNMTDNSLIGGIITRVRDATFFKEQETQLTSTVDDLKKINANLEDFVSVVSHDLRAPLLSMKGILDLIELKDNNAGLADEMEYLRGSVNKLDSFIVDLLDYSRCTRSELKPQAVCLEEILDDTTNYLKFMNPQQTPVEFKKFVKNGVLFHSDPKMLNIILNNLISNAIRYSSPNTEHPFVEVRINATDESAKIEVIDNGIGIAKEDQEKVFDMFFRVSSDNNGTGIGLHLVKLAVEKLEGEITIESEHNVGTKFSILIPNMLHNQN
jgi:PAS domain S-box-containing protein